MASGGDIRLKRAYDEPADNDGARILIDGMWPRGVAKEDAKIDEWLKDLAPSKSLRQWFGHDPERFEAFDESYRKELRSGEAADAFKRLREYYERGRVTLVYAAKDRQHNNAVVLKHLLQND